MNPWHEKIALKTNNPLKIIVGHEEAGTASHWHEEIEIVYILEGQMCIAINDDAYALKSRDILLISSCAVHRLYPNPAGCGKIILQIGKSVFGGYSDSVFGRRFTSPLLTTEDELHGKLESIISAILHEWGEGGEGFELVIKARIHDLGAAIIRTVPMEAYSQQERTRQLEQLERLRNVMAYIERDYASDITLQQAADLAGFSPTYFSRFFKEATGAGFVDYVNEFRANIAMSLLQSSHGESVTDIAFQAGFNSIETFNRIFKKVSGLTPSQFRNKK
ncbi:AraC family transcriptional regulator [Gorillibacterium massiliense]|uniref:AraC family transcriptional regulator n=1 Tax=Gorillibacterium massiliense TaxID=1280390 RepID=UPI0004BAA04E|nr:AraC family transcriptional regulator [Gorillibacterium massiliense]